MQLICEAMALVVVVVVVVVVVIVFVAAVDAVVVAVVVVVGSEVVVEVIFEVVVVAELESAIQERMIVEYHISSKAEKILIWGFLGSSKGKEERRGFACASTRTLSSLNTCPLTI